MFVVVLFMVLKTVHELPSADSSTVNIPDQSLVFVPVLALILYYKLVATPVKFNNR